MRKAINFDIDTKKYEKYTNKKASNAYEEIRRFLKKVGFKHRQGSGYISKASLADEDITAIIIKMSLTLGWLRYCIRQIDVTNIGKQHSLIDIINNSTIDIDSEILNITNQTK